ncbi:Adenylate and Guanylate cyclase catalytic domain containing protein [Histomonas meleagridis]|uniref:Adenylate and Guanylate cyclase catalytic domain containing protein n=1 Tax=Histomonas meleagridis TaxID=135588 RepID=UPI003559B0D1|nr:Adenylate and Guanylate cyclase catalytic domain containing protein [Histomonas meleagridis]KAH0802321.1 Adenylate and Guanylate cyclase catalytic domain containing protein [Histomonas meleagridis]
MSNYQYDEFEQKTLNQVIYDYLPTAIITIGNDKTINSMNEAAKTILKFPRAQIIGQKIDGIIKQVDGDENTLESQNDISSYKFYQAIEEKLLIENEEKSIHISNLEFLRGDNKIIQCDTIIYGIYDFLQDTASSFLIFFKDQTEDFQLQTEIQKAKDKVDHLMNQLIPSDVQGFIREDHQDFSFISKNVTIIAIQICGFFDTLKKNDQEDYLHLITKLYERFDHICNLHPPFIRQRQTPDIYLAISGLFESENNKVPQSKNAVRFGIDVIKDLETIDDNDLKEFSVKVSVAVGGPIYCTVMNIGNQRMFTISGQIIEETHNLLEINAPNRIIMNEIVKNEIVDEMEFEIGPVVQGKQTFLIPNFSNKVVVASSGSMANSYYARKLSKKSKDDKIKSDDESSSDEDKPK